MRMAAALRSDQIASRALAFAIRESPRQGVVRSLSNSPRKCIYKWVNDHQAYVQWNVVQWKLKKQQMAQRPCSRFNWGNFTNAWRTE
jgi:hypothetical protein